MSCQLGARTVMVRMYMIKENVHGVQQNNDSPALEEERTWNTPLALKCAKFKNRNSKLKAKSRGGERFYGLIRQMEALISAARFPFFIAKTWSWSESGGNAKISGRCIWRNEGHPSPLHFFLRIKPQNQGNLRALATCPLQGKSLHQLA
jgi:hypothetical protein